MRTTRFCIALVHVKDHAFSIQGRTLESMRAGIIRRTAAEDLTRCPSTLSLECGRLGLHVHAFSLKSWSIHGHDVLDLSV